MPSSKPKNKRNKTKYPGVYFIMGTSIDGRDERIYYIRYRKNGKMIDEKFGRQFQDKATPAKANNARAMRIRGDEPTNQERREAEAARKKAEEGRYTIDRLFNEYIKYRPKNKSLSTDKGRYEKYIKPLFGNKEPHEIVALDVSRLEKGLEKTKSPKTKKELSPQTIKHVLNLLTWIVNFGVKKSLSKDLSFHIQKPTVDNVVEHEYLTSEPLQKLLKAIDKDDHPQAGPMMKLALFSGLRRSEMFKLKWDDIDFEKGFIRLRNPKGKISQTIPLNDLARNLLESHPRIKGPYVFPGRMGRQRTDISKAVRKIRDDAGLPNNFRPLHGLRHAYASALASSGKVDMFMLQRLLTHKSPVMTQRYSHLRDSALKEASNVMSEVLNQSINDQDVNQKAG